MRLLTVVGARPQIIKAAPVSLALQEAGHEEVLVHTGQHYDYEMSQVFFDELPIPTHEELKSRTISDWALNPREAVLRKEVRRLLDEAIQALPPTYRAVVVLRDIDGLSTAEAARVLEINEGAVKTRLHRARIYLREALSPHFESEQAAEASGNG